jgi:glycine C-acetyltransferase
MGILPALLTEHTLVVSDARNHNCIINAIRLARPGYRAVYGHCDTSQLQDILAQHRGQARRAVVVTDGVFSMRGDCAPLPEIVALCERYYDDYPEGILTVVDDSHGVGAFGAHGRGTEEHTGAQADIVIATLGKALGVNGGYVVASQTVIDYFRETAPWYIYSNPISPAEAAAALQALHILASDEGVALAEQLFARDILATGLTYPVVPRGDEEIRFQLSAAHTPQDIACVLEALPSPEPGSPGLRPR